MSDTVSAEVLRRPVTELAAAVRAGELSPGELVETTLAAMGTRPELNAFVDVWDEEARAEAAAIAPGDPRPFAGVPIAIKGNRAVAGRRLTLGAQLMDDHRPGHSDNVVVRLRAAGFVPVASTTLPEYGILPVTETARFGATRNPWDLDRTPGGSSGGSAAAVAAGLVPIAHANDGGGSTRIPAACCGLVGLKPQRGRISSAPMQGDSFLVTDGVLTRTVAETAAVLDLLHGPVLGDSTWAPPPQEPFAAAAAREPGALRIALCATPPLEGSPVDPVCLEGMREAGRRLEALGHHVEEVTETPWAAPGLLDLFTAAFGPAVCTGIGVAAMLAGREPRAEDMEALSWAIWERCAAITSTQAALAMGQLQGVARRVVTWTAGWDVVVTPALAEAPVPIGLIDPQAADPMASFARSGRFTPYTAISNLTGSPAMSVPLLQRPDDAADAPGLPLGIQLVGQPAGEGALLALAAQLEAAHPWAGRRPS